MKRILVAEDRPSSRELICTVLDSAGYEILEAVDGEDALEKALHNAVDLIILDLQMPKIDGFGVLGALRKDARFASTPILALTASAMQGDRERALDAGFSSYIAKPVDLKALRSEIRRFLGS
jgi:two-component system, cell cycle response regulator DivK